MDMFLLVIIPIKTIEMPFFFLSPLCGASKSPSSFPLGPSLLLAGEGDDVYFVFVVFGSRTIFQFIIK